MLKKATTSTWRKTKMEKQHSFYVTCNGNREWHPTLNSALDYASFCFEDDDIDEVKIYKAEPAI